MPRYAPLLRELKPGRRAVAPTTVAQRSYGLRLTAPGAAGPRKRSLLRERWYYAGPALPQSLWPSRPGGSPLTK